MNALSMNSSIQQLEAMKSSITSDKPNSVANNDGPDFASLLNDSISKVNEMQNTSASMSESFVKGEINDLTGVMVAQQKSRVATTAMVEVRNKLLEAYRDVMNMSV